jgi:hypothetical protein
MVLRSPPMTLSVSDSSLQRCDSRPLPVEQQLTGFGCLNRIDQASILPSLPVVRDHFVKRADRASVGRVIEDKASYAPVQSDSID